MLCGSQMHSLVALARLHIYPPVALARMPSPRFKRPQYEATHCNSPRRSLLARWAASAASSCPWSWATPTTTSTRRGPGHPPSAVRPLDVQPQLLSALVGGLTGEDRSTNRTQLAGHSSGQYPQLASCVSRARLNPLLFFPSAAGQRALGFVLGNKVGTWSWAAPTAVLPACAAALPCRPVHDQHALQSILCDTMLADYASKAAQLVSSTF